MSPGETRKRTPPYISPRTFFHLIEDLAKAPVGRIDRTYLTTLHAGGTSGQIISALHYMNLLDSSGKPGVRLDLLAKSSLQSDKAAYRGYLRELIENSYGFALDTRSIDLENASLGQLRDLFEMHCGVKADVLRKCVKFFVSLALEAGVSLSPHITQKTREVLRGSATPKTTVKKTGSRVARPLEIPQQMALVPQPAALLDKLLAKFPDMDMAWSEDTKMRWLDNFQQIMIRIYPVLPPEK